VRVLLDECVPRNLRQDLPGHDVKTVVEMAWSGTKNGALLLLAAAEFDVMITVDQGIPHQQSLVGISLALIVLAAPSNSIESLRPLMAETLRVLDAIESGQVVDVGSGLSGESTHDD